MVELHPVDVRSGLVFGQVKGRDLALDLYVPADVDTPAAAMYLHGGAWLMGLRTDHRERLMTLAGLGIAVASIDYRTSDLAPYPAQRDDVLDALRWLDAEQAPASLAKGPVTLIGASAGAHLAAMTALTVSVPLGGVVGLFGRYELTSRGDRLRPAPGLKVPDEVRNAVPPAGFADLGPRGYVALLAGVEVDALDDAVLRDLSPACLVHGAAPPFLLLHGTADAVVPHAQSEGLAAAAAAHGIEVELELVPGANHEDPRFDHPEVLGRVADFVRRASTRTSVTTPTQGEV